MIHYGRHVIDADDIQAVVKTLQSDWLTTGPAVDAFEAEFADAVGASQAVAVSNGTAALHAIMHAIGIGPGDEVIVPAMTFAATANAVVYLGGKPVFADVDPDSLLIDPDRVEERIGPHTKAVIAVDYTGHPCDYNALKQLCDRFNLVLAADGCHALGAMYEGQKVGSLAEMTAFSFHPVKHITTGEGGMVTTNNVEHNRCLRIFRNHGISTDFREREKSGSWYYEMTDLGYNYRISDIQCALGRSQLKKLPRFLEHRAAIAQIYTEAFSQTEHIRPLAVSADVRHAWHLYVVRVEFDRLGIDRKKAFNHLRAKGIGVNVHYLPVHLHPFYQRSFGTHTGMCPIAESAYDQILSLPIHPAMSEADIEFVISEMLALGHR
jgi:perosamine synthetase